MTTLGNYLVELSEIHPEVISVVDAQNIKEAEDTLIEWVPTIHAIIVTGYLPYLLKNMNWKERDKR